MGHPLDDAREKLLTTLPESKRDVLRSKLHLVDIARSEATRRRTEQISTELGARGLYNSSANMRRCFEVAVEEADRAKKGAMDAAFSVGITDDEALSAFLSTDIEHFLESYLMSRYGHGDVALARSARGLAEGARAYGGRVRHEVRSARHDFEENRPPAFERALKWAKNNRIVAGSMIAAAVVTFLYGLVQFGVLVASLMHPRETAARNNTIAQGLASPRASTPRNIAAPTGSTGGHP